VQSLRDEISIANSGKIGNSAPTPKKLPLAPAPRHNKRIDKDLTCNSCGHFGKMTWTRGTTISEKIVVFLLGSFLYFVFVGVLTVITKETNIARQMEATSFLFFGLLPSLLLVISYFLVYRLIAKFIVTCPKCKNKGQVFSDIK
jgi:hypothetical protein